MNPYSFYSEFTENDIIKFIPFIEIIKTTDDKYVNWVNDMRLDLLSFDYYGEPNYGKLILMANPHLGNDEYDFRQDDIIRIPYPLNSAIDRYIKAVKKYNLLELDI